MARQPDEQSRGERQQTQQESKQNVAGRTNTGDGGRERERQIQTTRDQGVGRGMTQGTGFGTSGRSQALMRHMADDIDQLLQLFGFGGLGQAFPAELRTIWSPQIEVSRNKGQIVVRADLPGVDPSNVNVEIDDGVLTVSGERKEEREENDEGFFRSERVFGRFYRAIPLPEGVDDDEIQASFNNGVLEVKVPEPRQQQKQPKRVEVKARNP